MPFPDVKEFRFLKLALLEGERASWVKTAS